MKQFERVLESRVILETKAFGVQEDVLSYSDGTTSRHITALHRGAVVIIPHLAPRSFLLVDQYRHSIGRTLLEFPAGSLEPEEDPLAAAQREIREEVQHTAEQWTDLGIQYPTPGFCSEIQYCFLAADLRPAFSKCDEDEILIPVELSLDEIHEAVRTGRLVDAKSIAALARAELLGLI